MFTIEKNILSFGGGGDISHLPPLVTPLPPSNPLIMYDILFQFGSYYCISIMLYS